MAIETYPAGLYLFEIYHDISGTSEHHLFSFPAEFTDEDVLKHCGLVNTDSIEHFTDRWGEVSVVAQDYEFNHIRVDGYRAVPEDHFQVLREYLPFTHV